jgi:hypothetical protein
MRADAMDGDSGVGDGEDEAADDVDTSIHSSMSSRGLVLGINRMDPDW